MALFLRPSTTWVVDYRHDGHPRRWFRVLAEGTDPEPALREELQALYGARARLESVRPASADEEAQYLRGEAPRTAFCPTGRRRPSAPA